MSCNCIEAVNNKIQEHSGDPEAKVQTTYFLEDGKIKEIPYVYGTARKKKKDGTLGKKPERFQVSYAYCPFCGKKISEV